MDPNTSKMPTIQLKPLKDWPRNYDSGYCYDRLGISGRPEDQQVTLDLAQEIYDIAAAEACSSGRALIHLFMSSYSRDQIGSELRKRIPTLPAIIRNHITDTDLLVGSLYKYIACIQDDLQADFERRQNQLPEGPTERQETTQQPAQQRKESARQPAQEQSEESALKRPEQQMEFDYSRPCIVPNGDIQIVRADRPDMPIAIRPNMTIVIRDGNAKGGALVGEQPAVNRPSAKTGGRTLIYNRRAEQFTRYATTRLAKGKRKRAEARARATAEAEAETEGQTDAPPAQRRRLQVPHETVTTPSASPISDPALALAGQGPQEGDNGDAAFLRLLDPALFNEAGLVGNDSGNLQEFFEQNEWATDPMEED